MKAELRAQHIETFSQIAFATGTPQVPPTATDMTEFCKSIRDGETLGEAAAGCDLGDGRVETTGGFKRHK